VASTRKKSTRKKSTRKYGKAAGKSVKSAMERRKKGTLKSGPGGKGGTVKNRKQAIAIGLSEAREKGAKVPKAAKKSSRKKSAKKSAKKSTRKSAKKSTRKSSRKKSAR
jgi:hypothetical protein